MDQPRATIIGAGLAGTELALQLAHDDFAVTLVEMKPLWRTPAQRMDGMAELVCSNSLKAKGLVNAVGLLKEELRRMGSFVMDAADCCQVPAGGALAVDRDRFSAELTRRVAAHPNIAVRRDVCAALPQDDPGHPVVVATGPLSHPDFEAHLAALTGGRLHFYDAIAPIVAAEGIDREVVFSASRYDKGGDDYLNVPLTEEEYDALYAAISEADTVPTRDFEDPVYFEGCMPVEELFRRGRLTPAFGPFKPVGLIDPRNGAQPFAVVQLRKENAEGSAYNLVGFQTRMTYGAQRKILAGLPGLAQAEILRFGSLHRNSFLDAPKVLDQRLALRDRPWLRFAGQITGVEGYVESTACGLALAWLLRAEALGRCLQPPPAETAVGALLSHLRSEATPFQPSSVHFGLFPALPERFRKTDRKRARAQRALHQLSDWLDASGMSAVGPSRCVETLDDPPSPLRRRGDTAAKETAS